MGTLTSSYFYSSVRESSYTRLWCATVDNLLIEEGEKGWREEEWKGGGGRCSKEGLSSMHDACIDREHGCSGADVQGM